MVNFKLLEVKGDYDFGSKSSEYKANVGLGRAEVFVPSDDMTSFIFSACSCTVMLHSAAFLRT